MLNFYIKYQTEITWWVIGWISFNLVDCLLKGNYGLALLSAVLIGFNYKMWKER